MKYEGASHLRPSLLAAGPTERSSYRSVDSTSISDHMKDIWELVHIFALHLEIEVSSSSAVSAAAHNIGNHAVLYCVHIVGSMLSRFFSEGKLACRPKIDLKAVTGISE